MKQLFSHTFLLHERICTPTKHIRYKNMLTKEHRGQMKTDKRHSEILMSQLMGTNYSHIARLQEAIYMQSCKCVTETSSARRQRTKRKIAKRPDFPIVSFLSQLMLFIYKSKQAQWFEMTKKTHIHKIGKSIYMPLLPKVSVPSWTGVSQEMTLHRSSEWWIFDDTLCTQYVLKLQMSVFSRVDDENIDCQF